MYKMVLGPNTTGQIRCKVVLEVRLYIKNSIRAYPQMSSAGCTDLVLNENQNPGHFREIKQKGLPIGYSSQVMILCQKHARRA
jgi:hypothetical protein